MSTTYRSWTNYPLWIRLLLVPFKAILFILWVPVYIIACLACEQEWAEAVEEKYSKMGCPYKE